MIAFYSPKGINFPPELKLILACLRITPNEQEAQRIKELSRTDIDWPQFLRWVDRHRVAPLVCQNISRHGDSSVPVSVKSALKCSFESHAHDSLANASELVRLYRLFQENGIRVIPLKGCVLALQVYGNIALRQSRDIDLLIDPDQVNSADLLLKTSYCRIVPSLDLSPAQRERFLRFFRHFNYQRKDGGQLIELHWRALSDQASRIMEPGRLHSGGTSVALAGTPLPAIPLLTNLLYLCGHGAVHFWYRLSWLTDLAEIVRQHPEIDWEEAAELARQENLMRPLALGMLLAHELLGAPMPEIIRTYAMRDRMVTSAARFSCRYMLLPDPSDIPLAFKFQSAIAQFNFAPSFRNRLTILQNYFVRTDFMTIGLPDSMFFLYYLLRFPLWLKRRMNRTRRHD